MPDDFPITDYLIMEVLAARHRLGEKTWTFPSDASPALARLEARNMLGYKSGVIANTRVAWLTDTGRTAWKLDEPYGSRYLVDEIRRVPTLLRRVDAAFSHEARGFERMELYAIYRWAERLHDLLDSGQGGFE